MAAWGRFWECGGLYFSMATQWGALHPAGSQSSWWTCSPDLFFNPHQWGHMFGCKLSGDFVFSLQIRKTHQEYEILSRLPMVSFVRPSAYAVSASVLDT